MTDSQPIQKHPSRDERDATTVDLEAINQSTLYTMYSVFTVAAPLEAELKVDEMIAEIEADVTIRGWYDISGFRADSDLLLWTTSDDAVKLQNAYKTVRRSTLGASLEPFWSVVGVHRPAEFNRAHVPACFAGFAPRQWLTVYPFNRSYEWYYLDAEHRSKMLYEHGKAGREYPDVIANTTQGFALGDYEWILAFEADELHRLTDSMRYQRGVEARLHVREETPFFTGPRVELAQWVASQPHLAELPSV